MTAVTVNATVLMVAIVNRAAAREALTAIAAATAVNVKLAIALIAIKTIVSA